MKKVTLILSALALVLGLSQCKKQEEPVQSGEKQHIVLTATNGNDGSKVSGAFASAALNLTWEGNEKIIVSGGATGKLDFKKCEGTSATFVGDITKGSGDVVFTIGSTPSSYANQTGTADGCAAWIKGNNHFVGTSQWQDDGNYNVTMELQYAVLKLDVSALGTSGAMTIKVGETLKASVADVTSSEGKVVFVAVPANGSTTAYTISCGGKTATKTWKLEKNVFYTKAGAEGAGTGDAIVIDTPKFSVSSTTKVEFAPGNLYWNGSAFHFEANQWSFANTWDASHVSHFFWSNTTDWQTQGKEPYAESYSYSTQTEDDVFFTEASDFQVDGKSSWCTLNKKEWDYLLKSRTSASNLHAWVTLTDVNVNGYVILPDGSTVTASEVTTAESVATYGAVFLPAAGSRSGMTITNPNVGKYWSSAPSGDYEDGALCMEFDSNSWKLTVYTRDIGYSVRLVRNITE